VCPVSAAKSMLDRLADPFKPDVKNMRYAYVSQRNPQWQSTDLKQDTPLISVAPHSMQGHRLYGPHDKGGY